MSINKSIEYLDDQEMFGSFHIKDFPEDLLDESNQVFGDSEEGRYDD